MPRRSLVQRLSRLIIIALMFTLSVQVHPQEAAQKKSSEPTVKLLVGRRVNPKEVMIFTQSILIEEGPAVEKMKETQENITNVRYNMNTYRIGFSLAESKVEDKYQFKGQLLGWRAPRTNGISIWPPANYKASRLEVMRRARSPKPMVASEKIEESNNLRVYYYPSLIGHDGEKYVEEPSVIALYIHPESGKRMSVFFQDGKAYGSVGQPLSTTAQIFIQEVASQKSGILKLGVAHIPSIFYTKDVKFAVQPFAKGNKFEELLTKALDSQKTGTIDAASFKALAYELSRYTAR